MITIVGCRLLDIKKVWVGMHSWKNYLQQKVSEKSKTIAIYIDGRPKASGNIASFINSTWLVSTKKWPNCIFEAHEENHVFVCVIKSIGGRKELLIYYNLNLIDTNKATIMGEVVRTMHI